MTDRKMLGISGFVTALALAVAVGGFAASDAQAQGTGDGSNAAALTLKQKIQIAQDPNIPVSALTDGTAHRWLQEQRRGRGLEEERRERRSEADPVRE